jgi:cytochrome c
LRAEVDATVDPDLTVTQAHDIAHHAEAPPRPSRSPHRGHYPRESQRCPCLVVGVAMSSSSPNPASLDGRIVGAWHPDTSC